MNLSHRKTVWFCGLLMAVPAFSIDILLPMFGLIASDLDTHIDKLPFLVTAFMACMGLGQLFFGVLSDRFGRRLILSCGIGIFFLGTIAAGFAASFESMLIARCLQGFGAAAPHILSRAILRDMYSGTELAKKMAIATGIFSIGPTVAPLLGAVILEVGAHWRWVYAFMAVYVACLLYGLTRIDETNQNLNALSTKFSNIKVNAVSVIQVRQSRTFLFVGMAVSVSMILIISISPGVYKNAFNISGSLFALYYAVHGFGIILGQYANHYFIGKIGSVRTSILGTVIMLLSAVSISLPSILGIAEAWMVSLSLSVFAVGYLSVVANATSLLLQSHGKIIGFTTAFQGTVTMVFSGLFASVLSTLINGNIIYWGIYLAIGPAIVLFVLVKWLRGSYYEEQN